MCGNRCNKRNQYTTDIAIQKGNCRQLERLRLWGNTDYDSAQTARSQEAAPDGGRLVKRIRFPT